MYKINANPKLNILMSKNMTKKTKFTTEHFDALFCLHFQSNKILKSAQNTF